MLYHHLLDTGRKRPTVSVVASPDIARAESSGAAAVRDSSLCTRLGSRSRMR